MKLGAFSVSLAVKNLEESKSFYEKLGFKKFGGDMENNYLIMKNEESLIGLFQGMFENNILTFNPGWDSNAHNVKGFDDVRSIEKDLKGKGIQFAQETDGSDSGPASFVITDPDGNMIMVDQHI
jgi:catechol 2,3-dioxygenase-like lactoylglutathione lyase family enzyme